MQGKDLNLSLGYAHQVILEVPQGLKVECTNNTEITVSGYDKVEVGNFAAIVAPSASRSRTRVRVCVTPMRWSSSRRVSVSK